MKISDKKTRVLSRTGEVLCLIIMVLAIVLAVACAAATITLALLRFTAYRGTGYSGIIERWFKDNLGINQNYHTICGITLGGVIVFLGVSLIAFMSFSFFKNLLRAGNPADKKCVKSLRLAGLTALLTPSLSIVLCYVGLIIEHMIFPQAVLKFTGYSGLITGGIFGAYIGINLAFGVAAFALAAVKGALTINVVAAPEAPATEEVKPVEEIVSEEIEEAAATEEVAVAEEPVATVEEIIVPEEEAAATEEDATEDGKTSIGYDRSFIGKLMQAKDETKLYYSAIKNAILSYKGKGKKVSNRTSWKYETFNIGREKVVKMKVKGKTLCIYLALDPKTYADTKYKIEDASDSKSDVETPLMYRITNARRAKYVLDLIATVMENNAFSYAEGGESVDYVKGLGYKNDKKLVKEGLAKQVVVSSFPKN